jgi:two-component system, cell cycle sensor histidine kinase and response regulator CckA
LGLFAKQECAVKVVRVLVVEDSPTQAQELAWLLESEGFAVDVARNGEEGLARCQQAQYELVLSDVVMPGIDGYELCRRLKTDGKTHRIPVVLLTSLAEPMDVIRGLECGADNFLTKPYDAAYLIGRLRRLLEDLALRGERKVAVGVEVVLLGRKFTINSDREQMLDLLMSTFEEVLRSRQREYETKLTEQTLRESHRLLQSALDALPEQIAIIHHNGSIVAANAAFRSSLGDTGVVGLPYIDVWKRAFGALSEDTEQLMAGIREVHDGSRQSFSLEYSVTLEKEQRWFALRANRFPDRGERLLAIENQDITVRKRLETQLRHSQKMEAIGQLAGGIAHDFNNLLAVIQSYGQFLVQDLDAADSKRGDVEQILLAAEAASGLTRQLLAFSRQQVLKPQVLDPNVVIRELEKMLRRVVGEDVEYVAVLDPAIGRVRADVGQLQQILMNLVVNARDAMPSGGKLTLETGNFVLDDEYARVHEGVSAGEYVAISVTDTGTGMDADTQLRIFEPFFTTKVVGRGTGLGLSTVYGIVQQSGGHIWLYSELGRGTTFRIYLPLVDEPTATARRALPVQPVGGSETVLVVEDNDAVRTAISRILRRAGYDVLEAEGAAEARALCSDAARVIHLLITDVVMPQVSGPDLAIELSALRPQLKVLFMSGYSGNAITRHGVLREGLMFLQKPFSPESVTHAVREVLASPKVDLTN